MEWGHTQNLLSVIVGLNIAYYSFKEIRAPELARFVASVDDLTADIESTLNDIRAVEEWECLDGQTSNIADSQLEYRLIDVQLSTNILKHLTIAKLENTQLKLWENNFGRLAMVAALMGILLLIASTVNFGNGISTTFFYIVTVLGF